MPANIDTCTTACDIRLGFYLTDQGHRWVNAMRDMAQVVPWDMSVETWFERYVGSIAFGFLLEEGGCRRDRGGGGGGGGGSRPDNPPGRGKHWKGDLTDQWYDFLRKRRQEQDTTSPEKEKRLVPAGKIPSKSNRDYMQDDPCQRVWSKVSKVIVVVHSTTLAYIVLLACRFLGKEDGQLADVLS